MPNRKLSKNVSHKKIRSVVR